MWSLICLTSVYFRSQFEDGPFELASEEGTEAASADPEAIFAAPSSGAGAEVKVSEFEVTSSASLQPLSL